MVQKSRARIRLAGFLQNRESAPPKHTLVLKRVRSIFEPSLELLCGLLGKKFWAGIRRGARARAQKWIEPVSTPMCALAARLLDSAKIQLIVFARDSSEPHLIDAKTTHQICWVGRTILVKMYARLWSIHLRFIGIQRKHSLSALQTQLVVLINS